MVDRPKDKALNELIVAMKRNRKHVRTTGTFYYDCQVQVIFVNDCFLDNTSTRESRKYL